MDTAFDFDRYDHIRPILWTGDALELLDQRRLPFSVEHVTCRDSDDVARAIHDLAVRGAPAIGIAAAWGVVLAAREVEGSIWSGSSLGVLYGFFFTFLPLLVIAWAIRKRRSWKAWLAFAALAIVLALPNLFTLGIVLGRGNAAHAGERTLDVEAPGFRNGTGVGVVLALLAFGVLWWLLRSRRSARHELERMRADARRTDEAVEPPPPPA